MQFHTPAGLDTEQFKADIAYLKSQGRKVMISLGGGGQHFTLPDPQRVPNFVSSVTRIVSDYGFDGIDIDFESPSLSIEPGDTDFRQPTTPSIVNLISAVRQLSAHFGAHFIVSLVPEGTQIPSGYPSYGGQFGSYLPIAHALRDILSFIDVQDYNTPPLQGLDGEIYQPGTVDYHAAMTELFLHGFNVGGDAKQFFPPLPAGKFAVGFLTGDTTPGIVNQAMDYIITGKAPTGTKYKLRNRAGYPAMMGAMFWTIDADRRANYNFSNSVGPQLHGYPASKYVSCYCLMEPMRKMEILYKRSYGFRFVRPFFFAAIGTALALGQNITVDIALPNPTTFSSNAFLVSQSGSASALGNATLVSNTSATVIANGQILGPVQVTGLYFNELDSIAINYTESDPNFGAAPTVTMSGGSITGGTGAYAGASGSLDLTVVKDMYGNAVTTGTGTLIAGGNTTPLALSNFQGPFGVAPERDYFSGDITATGSLGNGTGTLLAYVLSKPPNNVIGSLTLAFNQTDTLSFWFSYIPDPAGTISPPANFAAFAQGGTGKYANLKGPMNFASGNGYHVTGTLSPFTVGGTITEVKTAYGLPQLSPNTWLEIHGQNLVPADTPPAGVDWSNAPEFASGMMPTQLGPISVSINGMPAYIYYYCSAATNPNCGSGDQINVLAPVSGPGQIAGPALIYVNNNGTLSRTFTAFAAPSTPAFLSLDTAGHVAARHQDSSLVAPASLYPGASTPAKVGETISVYGVGFGIPAGSSLVAGSATQTAALTAPECSISGLAAPTVGALVSPGLYQFNITIPAGVKSGDNLLNCLYLVVPTFPGALVAVQ